MKKINFQKDILPHAIAIGVFLIITIILFYPLFFENKTLSQHDIQQWKGGAQEIIDYKKETGDQALWTNSMFSGMPAYLVSLSFAYDPVSYIYKILSLWLPSPANKIFLAFVCFYILLNVYGVKRVFSIAGSLSFGLSSFLIISIFAGHNAKVAAIAFIPLVIAGIHLIFNQRKNWGALLLMIGLSCQLYVNHLQITYYTIIIALIYAISELIVHVQKKSLPDFFKLIPFFAIALIIALGANMGRILTVMEYSEFSTRGPSELLATNTSDNKSGLDKEYVFRYSNGMLEPLVMFIPNFLGGSSQQELDDDSNLAKALKANGVPRGQVNQQIKSVPTYFGDQPLTAPYYAGAIIVFLFVLGLIIVDDRHRFWLLATVIISLMLSWGSNFSAFNNFLFDYLPGYNKFRSVTFSIIIAIFSINLLGSLAISKLLEETLTKALKKKLFIAASITGGFALLVVVFAGLGSYSGSVDAQLGNIPGWFLQAIKKDRESLVRADAFRTFILIALFCVSLLIFYLKRINLNTLGVILIVLVCFDGIGIDKRFLQNKNFARNSTKINPTPADQSIANDKGHYRVLNLNNPFNEANTSNFHHSIGGYHGAKLHRYQDLVERAITPQLNDVITLLRSGSTSFNNTHVINMLNTKYIKFGDKRENVIPNSNAFGNAWWADLVIHVNTADDEMDQTVRLSSPSTAIVDQSKFSLKNSSYDQSGSIILDSYSPDKMVYKTKGGTSDRLALFSEVYYPKGWSATIDGKTMPILRANYILRALEVPAGEHTIEFTFEPNSYYVGKTIMAISATLIFILFAGMIFMEYKKSSVSG